MRTYDLESHRTVRILHLDKRSLLLTVNIRTVFSLAIHNPHIRSDAPVCIVQLQIWAHSRAQSLFILGF